MLCHQHPADAAHAACQRCQRGLCRGCTKLFLQRLCTHCIEQSVTKRTREARRTLWLTLPVLTLAAWAAAMALPQLAPRPRLYFAGLAGMVALGAFLGLRRWRRAPGLASGIASLPESETPFWERVVKPALAGIAFWPWLLVETLRDMQLANRLRAYVPPENRASTFGFGEASLAFASLAAAFTLGTHGLSSYTPVAGKLWATEASLAGSAQQAVRDRLAARIGSSAARQGAPDSHDEAAQSAMGEAAAGGARSGTNEAEPSAAARAEREGSPAEAERGQAEPQGVPTEAARTEAQRGSVASEAPRPEATAGAAAPSGTEPAPNAAPVAQRVTGPQVPPLPELPDPAAKADDERPAHGHRHRKHDVRESEPVTPSVAEVEPEPPEPAPPVETAVAPPPPVLDRRFVPGSEMAKQAATGNRVPSGTYVTSSGRVVMPAPPPK